MKQVIFIVFMFCSIAAFSQREVIAIRNKKDTVSIKHFDALNNLVFWKYNYCDIEYGAVFAYSYNENNKKTREVSFGLLGVSITEYDTLQNVRKTFIYVGEDYDGMFFIYEINNIKELEESTKFKKIMEKRGYLYEITNFIDTLPVRSVYFDENGDTLHVIEYSYNSQNLLIFEQDIYSVDYSSETFYEYDTLGRILYKKTPFSSFKYDYKTPNIIKMYEVNTESGKITSTEIGKYKNGKIVKRTTYDTRENIEEYKFFISYKYDKKNRLVREYFSRCFGNKPLKTRYIYK